VPTHRRSSRFGHRCLSHLACGPLPDVAADDIEYQIDAADAFYRVIRYHFPFCFASNRPKVLDD
jgi:hypothetical protein